MLAGDRVNVERSLRVGARIDGHFVQGHVDGTGRLVNRIATDEEWRLTIETPPHLAKYLVPKGSICVDGVSLTVNEVEGREFGVNIIPHTWTATTLGALRPGDPVHIEIDMLARYVARLAEAAP